MPPGPPVSEAALILAGYFEGGLLVHLVEREGDREIEEVSELWREIFS
jgi:hypothetical protein